MSTVEKVVADCRAAHQAAEKSLVWLQEEANCATVGRDRDELVREMRRYATRVRRLERAAARPMCVGVFGPSQHGKSYLVSVLARSEAGSVRAHFDGHEPIDFLSKINPVGEKESTGVVCRFTSRRASRPAPPGFPVRLRLLTELDLVKILGNSFFHDGKQADEPIPTVEEVFRDLDLLRTRPGGGPSDVTSDDVFDLREYFHKCCWTPGAHYLQSLNNFWGEARALAPKLDLDGRARLFSFLWGRHSRFTDLYIELVKAIELLGRADEAFCPLEALLPREESIINVDTLSGLGQEKKDRLKICSVNGSSIELPRQVITALIAELHIDIGDPSGSLLSETDLLDFPGARNRTPQSLKSYINSNGDNLKDLYLRGKVAYLFDRYVAEQELTCMVLCLKSGNQDTVSLPEMISNWVADTHGGTPEARRDQKPLLFLALTWFDTHFGDKSGDDDQNPGVRFQTRFTATFDRFLQNPHKWPKEWTPHRPFQNCYWIRNPKAMAETIIRYENRVEIEFIPERRERIERLRGGFLALPEAHARFQNPERAFDEALKLNDGGVSYLAENLEMVCRREYKLAQVSVQIAEVRKSIWSLIAPFYVSSNLTERSEQRKKEMEVVFDAIRKFYQHNVFGGFIRHLIVDPGDLTDDLHEALRRTQPESLRANGTSSQRHSDRYSRLANIAVDAWVMRLRKIAEDGREFRGFPNSGHAVKETATEIIALVRRSKVEENIAEDLRSMLNIEPSPSSSAKIAAVAAARINRLVGDFGFGALSVEQRPKAGTDVAIFGPREVVYTVDGIGQNAKPFAETYFRDWTRGFEQVIVENITSSQGIPVNIEQNLLLKSILDSLSAPAPSTKGAVG